MFPVLNWQKIKVYAIRPLLFVLLNFCALSSLQAKEVALTLRFENEPLKTILNAIEKQAKIVFVYNNQTIDNEKIYSINCKKTALNTVLQTLFQDKEIGYELVDYYVFLTEIKETNNRPPKITFIVEGKVVDEQHKALPGVSVLNTAQVLKTVTDVNGYFRFEATKSDSAIVFYMMGFFDKRIPLSSKNVEVVLLPNNFILNELLVVGYGTVNAKELTGSVVSIKPELFNKSVDGDLSSSFQGRVAGVYANLDRLRVRGVSSINSSSDPFIVVDGIPQAIQLKDLNPDDIASIEVLKDAASASIYGSRAANGVILVTTKSGTLNTPLKLSVDFRSGLNFIVNQPRYLQGAALVKVLDDAYYNKYPERKLLPENNPLKYFPFSSDYTGFGGYNRSWLNSYLSQYPNGENWSQSLSQPMKYNDLRLSFNGGQSLSKYLVSFSYRANNDFTKGKSNERLTLLLKNEYTLAPWLVFGLNSNASVNLANNTTYPSAIQLFSRSSLLPVYSPDNSGALFDKRNINDKKGSNPLYQMQETWDDNVELNNVISSFLHLKPTKFLEFRTDWSVSMGTRRYRAYQSKDFYREDEAIDPAKSGVILYARTLNYGLNGNNVFTFKPDFSEKHHLKMMVGNNIQTFNSDFNVSRFEGFPTNYFELTNASSEKVYTKQSAGMDGYRFVSFFTRTQYSFKEKYFAELNARADATSRFNPNKRWGYFPGLGFSYLLSEEPIVKKNIKIDYLKLRTSYGFVGNAEMGNFPAQSRVVNWAEFAGSPGFLFDRIGNRDVSWEKQTQVNLGLNASAFKNRMVVSLDWFYKRSDDLLINYNIGVFQGYFSTDVTLNTGSMSNKGLELSLSTQNLVGKFSWKTDFNISSFQTKVLQLSSEQEYIEKGVNRVYQGHPLGLYFLPLWAGVNPATGHELIYEVTGPENAKSKTGRVLDAELLEFSDYNNQRVLITDKSPYPDFYGGITNVFNYKDWEFSFLFSFQYGNWLYHTGLRQASYVTTFDIQNKYAVLSNHWSPENSSSTIPLLYNSQMAGRDNSRYLVDGSYLRLRNISLNYALPRLLAENLHTKSIKLFIQAQNLFTLTKFKDGDPEVAVGASGVDANIAPGNVGSNYGTMSLNLGCKVEF